MHIESNKNEFEVIVIGGGISGMATSIHLARAGMKVACIHSEELSSDPVGESLDWSAPDLLNSIGLPMDELVERGIATTKEHVILKLLDGSERHYVPGAWLAKSPFNVRLDTIHVDRGALAGAIREITDREGVRVLSEQVIKVQQSAGCVVSVTMKNEVQLHAKWFVDASGGRARLFARTFDLPMREYGPSKVALWEYFGMNAPVAGTTIYGSGSTSEYMDWIWQIPIHPDLVSVGCVSTGEGMKQQRQSGLNVKQIYEGRLREFPALTSLLHSEREVAPRVTSFRCRTYWKVSGPNWLIVGEAAAMVDPMTSNGVTSALRHASEAAEILIRYQDRKRLPWLARSAYASRVRDVAAFFNSLIETIMYEASIRARFGALAAGDIYTIPAWLMNLVYSRSRPKGLIASVCFGTLLRSICWSAATLSWFCSTEAHLLPH